MGDEHGYLVNLLGTRMTMDMSRVNGPIGNKEY